MLLSARVLTGFGLLSLSALPVIHAAAPNAIGIKLVGRGSLLGRGETAGVVPAANWNNAIGLRGESALVDAAGVATGVTVAWAAQAMGNLLLSDTPGNPRLMLGYLDTLGTAPTTISVSNLPAWAPGYYVYVYADGYSGTFTRTAVYRLAGAFVRVTDNTDFTGAFTLANGSPGNYALFTVQGGTFTLTAEAAYSTDRFLRAPVNAIQIVPAAAGAFIVASNPVGR